MSEAIKERPILFQDDMIRAWLAKLKRQTRRVVKPQLGSGHEGAYNRPDGQWAWTICEGVEVGGPFSCPYGKPGDRLWVREAWRAEEMQGGEREGLDGIRYRADNTFAPIENTPEASDAWGEAARDGMPWRPSIFMPRWASRGLLEVTDVRAERVQDISEADAQAEGIKQEWTCVNPGIGSYAHSNDVRDDFMYLWDSINAKPKPVGGKHVTHYVSYPWEDVQETREHRGLPWYVMGNPYVWAMSFKDAA